MREKGITPREVHKGRGVPTQFDRFKQNILARNRQTITAIISGNYQKAGESVAEGKTRKEIKLGADAITEAIMGIPEGKNKKEPASKIIPFSAVTEAKKQTILEKAVRATAAAAASAIPALPAIDLPQINSHVQNQAIHRPATQEPQKAYEQLTVIRNKTEVEKTLKLKTSPNSELTAKTIEASRTVTNTYGPEVTREWLEANHQDILGKTDITDAAGNVIKQYVLVKKVYDTYYNLWDSVLYETHKDQAGLFTQYKAVAKAPGNIRAIASSTDGNIVVVGGENPMRSAMDSLKISYEGGKNFHDVPLPYGIAGGATNIIRINDTTYLINNGNYEGGTGQAILTLDPITKGANIQTVSLETVIATNFNAGSAYDLEITNVNPLTHTAEFVSNASYNLGEGIIKYKLDYITGQGTLTVTKTVNINGVETNLGLLYGRAIYIDANGHTHFVSSNPDRRLIYDIDMDEGTATQTSYANLLDNKGIPDYMNGGLDIIPVDVYIDQDGNPKKIYAGAYAVWGGSRKIGPRAVLLNEDGSIFFDLGSLFNQLDPALQSGILRQRDVQKKTINGQLGYELNIWNIGKAFIPLNPDGSLIPDAQIYFTDGGLETALPDPYPFKLHLPRVAKSYMGGW